MAKNQLLNTSIRLLEALTAHPLHRLPVELAALICDTDQKQLTEAIDALAMLSCSTSGVRVAIQILGDEVVLDGDGGYLQPLRLTSEEAFAVGEVLENLEVDEGLVDRVKRAALDKGTALGDAQGLVEDTTTYGDFYPQLANAVAYGARIRLRYRSAKDPQARERIVDPHHIETSDGPVYLVAWDTTAGVDGERRYRLDRIENVVDTGDSVVEHPWSNETMDQSMRHETRTATLQLDPSYANHVKWPALVKKAHADGSDVYELPLISEHWLFDQILGSEGQARIIAPEDLKARFITYANALL